VPGSSGTTVAGSVGTTVQGTTGTTTAFVAAGETTTSAAPSGAGVSPGVTLASSTPDAQTGGEEGLLAVAGLGIAGASELARRRLRRARQ
jgi:hypothetical protein